MPASMEKAGSPCGHLDEPKPLYRRPICLDEVSKNLSGDLDRLARPCGWDEGKGPCD